MTFILGLLLVTAAISSILLMVVVLLQEPKGGGIAAALGGSGMEAIGVNTGSVNKFTSWVAGIWVGSCFLHAILMPAAEVIAPANGDDATITAPPEDAGSDGNAGGGESGTEEK
jgi:protein translocase SecG subunit